MRKATDYALITCACNFIVFMILFAIVFNSGNAMEASIIFLLIIPAIILIAELIVGLVLSFSKANKVVGQGILIGFGISILIGLSVCSLVAYF